MTASTDSGTKSSTGSEVLDDALRGGFPERRTVLVTGGPGTGKTTLAMQFLQAGIDAGESGLFVSTEQTAGELRDAFAGFEFDVDHPDLTTTSLHATTGYTLEDDEETLTLKSLEGDESVGDGYSTPFEPQHVTTHLERHGPVDRVVVDSVSGLSAMGDGYDRFRRAVFDLVRLFNDEFGATAVFTAEETGGTRGGERGTDGVRSVAAEDAVQFNTHGVVRLWREAVGGEFHRFLEVTKMRGVDHDTRVYEVDIEPTGLRAYPRMRTHPGEFVPDDYMATGIEGLDDRLFLLDFATVWENTRRNVFEPTAHDEEDTVETFRTADERRGDRSMLSLLNVEAQLPVLGTDQLRRVRFWEEENFYREGDTSVYFFNPDTMTDRVGAFYRNAAWQVIRTWLSEKRIQ
jgi:KaiC/GvpD/RAD55 family RecA-like ATPase